MISRNELVSASGQISIGWSLSTCMYWHTHILISLRACVKEFVALTCGTLTFNCFDDIGDDDGNDNKTNPHHFYGTCYLIRIRFPHACATHRIILRPLPFIIRSASSRYAETRTWNGYVIACHPSCVCTCTYWCVHFKRNKITLQMCWVDFGRPAENARICASSFYTFRNSIRIMISRVHTQTHRHMHSNWVISRTRVRCPFAFPANLIA